MPSLANSARARVRDVLEVDLRAGGRGDERGAQRDLADVAAGEVDLARELAEGGVVERVRFLGQARRQIFSRASASGRGKVDDEAQPAQERGSRFCRRLVVRIARPSYASMRCSR